MHRAAANRASVDIAELKEKGGSNINQEDENGKPKEHVQELLSSVETRHQQ